MHERSHGLSKRYKKAVLWYQKAADQKFAHAQLYMVSIYEHGLGMPKNSASELSWYRMAAAQELLGAQKRVAELEVMRSPAGMASKQCANYGALEALGGAALMPCGSFKATVYEPRNNARLLTLLFLLDAMGSPAFFVGCLGNLTRPFKHPPPKVQRKFGVKKRSQSILYSCKTRPAKSRKSTSIFQSTTSQRVHRQLKTE